MDIIFNEFKPSLEISPYIELFWTGKFNVNSSPFLSQRVVPNGYVELIIHLSDFHCELLQGNNYGPSPDYTLIGLFTKHYDVHFRKIVNVFGIRFKPEGIYHIFGVPASEIQQDFADMENITGRHFREYTSRLREAKTTADKIRLSESYLKKNLNRGKINLYYLNHAAEIIRKRNGLISVEQLSSQVYIGKRQLEREFKQKMGISPKSYMRISRLNAVNRWIQNGKRIQLTNLAYACGYADQAHFIRDFKNFTGESPTVFVKEKEKFIVNPNIAEIQFSETTTY